MRNSREGVLAIPRLLFSSRGPYATCSPPDYGPRHAPGDRQLEATGADEGLGLKEGGVRLMTSPKRP
jgi:hypothetical protein